MGGGEGGQKGRREGREEARRRAVGAEERRNGVGRAGGEGWRRKRTKGRVGAEESRGGKTSFKHPGSAREGNQRSAFAWATASLTSPNRTSPRRQAASSGGFAPTHRQQLALVAACISQQAPSPRVCPSLPFAAARSPLSPSEPAAASAAPAATCCPRGGQRGRRNGRAEARGGGGKRGWVT